MTEDADLKPITPARLAREVASLSKQRQEGTLDANLYDQKFARMIGELRERKVEGNRQEILAALTPLRDQGLVTAAELEWLVKKLDL